MRKALAILLVALFVMTTGCSLFGGLEQDIIGTWKEDGQPGFTITFAKDGDFSTSDGDTGTWKINDETLVVTWSDGESIALGIVSIDKETMILSYLGQQESYTRK
ncbi:MAG: lipocalin family protein [Spirochaetia bacterium]|jgi:hypothetical protein|nr:lipocalin family protein [Spirochaetia bacterium]